MRRETLKALGWAVAVTAALAVLVAIGSRNLTRFDASLVAYTFAALFAIGGITYRYAIWLQRPPTALYWRRGWETFLARPRLPANLGLWARRLVGEFALNDFIFRRGRSRWAAHWLIMWGCVLAIAITFPLVFGWLSFYSVSADITQYRVDFFGFPTVVLPARSLFAFLLFHGLDVAAVMIIPGVMLAMRRRMTDEGASAVQLFSEDFVPLILLFAISLSGLLLTVDYTWMEGYGYDFLKLFHAITVIVTLVYIPFGKFFHIPQRPAQLGVEFYKDLAARSEPARCRRCGRPFASRRHAQDLIRTQHELGYRYEMAGEAEHYGWICPPCRRAAFSLAQGRLGHDWPGARPAAPLPQPEYVNAGLGEGPLGPEDAGHFHP